MPIDWFTVVAQIINFLILVWLLKRFLYKPILKAIDDREKRIAAELAQAEAKSAEALRERDNFRKKNEDFDQQRVALFKQVTDAANVERQRLLDEARKEADTLRAKRRSALQNERQQLSDQIKRWTQKEVFEIARKLLVDLADTNLEERIGAVFVERLRALSGTEKEQLMVALKSQTDSLCVRSAFELPQSVQNEVETAIKEVFATEGCSHFEIAPEIVSGIELSVNGQKVAWSIADYLGTLEKNVSETLDSTPAANANSQTVAPSEPASTTQPYLQRDEQLELTPPAAKGVR